MAKNPPYKLLIASLVFLASAFFSFNSVAHAKPWVLNGATLDERANEKLKSKYPDISSQQDLQNFLRDLTSLVPLNSAEAYEMPDKWDIRATGADKIVRIDFRLVSRTFRADLENLSQKYLGFVDSESIRKDLQTAVETLLRDRGYPKPVTSFSAHKVKGGIRYRFRIDYGYPCLIESISFAFPIPRELEFDVRPGDVCDKNAIADAIVAFDKDLEDDGYNQVRLDAPKYVYNSKANTMRVQVTGELGNKVVYEIVDKERGFFLTDLFTSSEMEDLDPGMVSPDAMALDIKDRYQNRGYDDVVVEGPEVIKGKDSLLTYRFTVRPGTYYELTNIQFQGANVYSRREMNKYFEPESWFATSRPLNPDLLQTGIENLKNKYREDGFWDIDIKDPRISKNKDAGEAQALIVIEEGVQRRFAGIQVRGATVLKQDDIKDHLDLNVGDPFNQAKLLDFEKGVREDYLAEGYLYAEIYTSLEQRAGLNSIFVTVNVSIDEGERVKIGDITVNGLVDTHPKVVTRELHFATGDYYDPNTLDTSRRALLSLGIFQTVQILPADRNAATEKEPVLDIVVEVKEAKPGNVSFGPGWSLLRGNRFTAESSYSNIGGVGRQIYARGQISEEAHQSAIGPKTLIGRTLSVGYVEPYIFNIPINATASASNSARADDRWQLSTTGEVALTHKFRKFIFAGSTISTFYGQKINREESSEKERTGFLRLLGGSVRSGRIGLRYAWDHRNDITWPTSGFMLNSEFSRARFQYGGNLAYKYWQFGSSYYYALRPSTVLAFGFAYEAFQDVDRKGGESDVLPQSETLFVGGAETVRGFPERSLGPMIFYGKDRQELGGSHSNYYKLELRQKVYSETTAITGFIDTGNVFFSRREMSNFSRDEAASRIGSSEPSVIKDNVPYQFEDIFRHPEYIYQKNYAAYGTAFNYLTPLGSINLAYGLPWKTCAQKGSDCVERGVKAKHWLLSGVFHINIGTNF